MERIEVKTATLMEGWRPPYTLRRAEFILGTDIDKVRSLVKTFDISSRKITDVKRIFFDKNVLFPRSRFKEDYPNIKRVIDINRADAIVIQKSKLISEFSGLWCTTLYFRKGSTDTNMLLARDKNMTDVDMTIRPIDVFMPYRMSPTLCERLNKVSSYEGKDIIDLSQITLHGEEDLDDIAFEKISSMLNSTDEQMRIMALSLLTGFEYETNKDKISLLLKLNNKGLSIKKSLTVDVKALLERSGLETSEYSTGSHIIRCCIKLPDDKVYQAALNDWLKRVTSDNSLPKISINTKSEENENSENDKVEIDNYEA